MLLKYHKVLTWLLFFIASLDVLAWQLNHDMLLAWVPWFKGMTFNTALGFISLSLAILLFQHNTLLSNRMARFLLLSWGIFASFSLAQDVFQVNLGLDQWFLTLPQETDHTYAGRMSPLTAMAFITSSFILIMVMHHQHFKHSKIIVLTLILLLILLVLQGLSLHFFHVHANHTWAHLASMSLMTSFSFFLIILITLSLFRASNTT
ncbi:MAG: hypothetical protein Q9M10_03140 [Mariprofundaceae bacterium]|nr:hypothetical protein [Mariprofundaceae bacterium]